MVNEVRFWTAIVMMAVFVSVVAFLIARDVIHDKRRRKPGSLNSAVPRGPWYPRFLPLGHFFDGVGEAIEHDIRYREAPGRVVTALAFLAFLALVWGIVWLLS
jgi:hypothetical protein